MKKTNFTLLFFLVSSLLISAIIDHKGFDFINPGNNNFLEPDSTYEDSTEIVDYEIDDTMTVSIVGLDSLFILFEDSSFADIDTITDSSEIELRDVDVTTDMVITPGGIKKDIEKGLFGYHIEGMFTPKHQPEDDDNVNYPGSWSWLADLKPSVIRFPGGASSRWMHLLDYDTDGNGFDDKFPIGYGYDLKEIIRYYDVMNETDDDVFDNIQADDPTYMESIITDLVDEECDYCSEWMDDVNYESNLEDLAKSYFQQINDLPLLDQQQQYIDQFISLINYVEDQENYTVDVIVDLNVISETASQNRRIIDYLISNGVHVVGVELGNEMNLKWAQDMMGYIQFDDYWNFMQGHDFDGVDENETDDPTDIFSETYQDWIDNYYTYVLNPAMQEDHNFISAFKADPDFECKVGIAAGNLKAGAPDWYALKGEDNLSDDWNEELVEHYEDYITVNDDERFLFDAVVLHPYYEPSGNYLNIPLDYYCNVLYPASGTAPICTYEGCDSWELDRWKFTDPDDRLRDPFEKLLGLQSNEPGNFEAFIKNRYDESYDAQNDVLKFYLKKKWQKDLWTTEWNLKDRHNSYPSESYLQLQLSSYVNSFAHGLLIQEWFLNDLKKNFDTDFRKGFHTYSTFHGWGGGSYYSMLLHSDEADRLYHLDEDGESDPLSAPPSGQLLWLKRTMYYTFELLSEITKHDLKYVPSNHSMYVHNSNVAPTVFINNTNLLYIYYSNMKNETQSYVIKHGHLIDLFPEAVAIGFGNAEIYNVDPLRLYSTSGRSKLYDMNTCYNDEDQFHPFEIQGITGPTLNDPECTGLPGGAICVTVPASSFGYFTIPIYTSSNERLSISEDQINIYPNPAGSSFMLSCAIPEILIDEFAIDVFNLNGERIISTTTAQNSPVDISSLTSGIYMIAITNKEKTFYVYKKLVKIE